jgi:hypothetical protein
MNTGLKFMSTVIQALGHADILGKDRFKQAQSHIHADRERDHPTEEI